MPIPSRLLGSGVGAQAAQNICGDVGDLLVAAGSNAGTALQLTATINNVGTTGANTGVKLPPTEAGASVFVFNTGASTLTVYPATSSTINGAASVTIATTKAAVFFATTGTKWFSIAGA